MISTCSLFLLAGIVETVTAVTSSGDAGGDTDGAIHLGELVSSLNIDASSPVTVSGVSSGGYMAVQMHIAFSASIKGAAIFAAGPYYCANSNVFTATENCMKGTYGGPPLSELIAFTEEESLLGTIDHVSNLKDDPVYIFSGTLDSVVVPSVVHSLKDFYSHFLPVENISDDFDLVAEHCVPTVDYQGGEVCEVKSSPYLGKCGYDGAGQALKTLYSGLSTPSSTAKANAAKAATSNSTIVAGNPSALFEFLQTEFYPYGTGHTTNSLDDTGFVYVPSQCYTNADESAGTRCRVHMSFHGCEQGQNYIGNEYAAHAGFNSWADENNLIVVYPYAQKDDALGNPNGCWDWWGYTNTAYGLKSGTQMTFAKNIIDAMFKR